jgi:hypothetical protein
MIALRGVTTSCCAVHQMTEADFRGSIPPRQFYDYAAMWVVSG